MTPNAYSSVYYLQVNFFTSLKLRTIISRSNYPLLHLIGFRLGNPYDAALMPTSLLTTHNSGRYDQTTKPSQEGETQHAGDALASRA